MIDERHSIAGSGGGGKGGKGGGGGSKESPDTLFSRSTAKALLIVAEGQIEGFRPGENPGQKIYIDSTPLIRQDGSANFGQFNYSWTPGAPGEGPMSGFETPSAEQDVSTQLRHNIPIVRQFFNIRATKLSITMRVGPLYTVKKDKIEPTSVTIRIEISPNGLPWQLVEDVVISGKTNSTYTKQKSAFDLPVSSNSTWQIRLTRLTGDSGSATLANDSYWASYTIFEPSGKIYPSTAKIGLSVRSDQFSNFPTLSADMWGINDFKIPHNYDPFARTYTGIFNGLLVTGWTNNPAWILYNLLINSRYGAGSLPGYPGINADRVDVWSFYQASVYNDSLVPDGFGGTEPRYRFDAYQTSAVDAEDMFGYLEQCMRARLFDNGQKISLRQDRPRSWVRIFHEGNVVHTYNEDGIQESGGFSYESVDITTASNDIECRFINPGKNWEEDSESYRDTALIQRNGQRKASLDGVGVTSRGQALRMCKWEFFTANFQPYICTFSVGDEGELVSIGDVIKVSDPSRLGANLGGRIAANAADNAATLTLDDAPGVIPAGSTISILTATGAPFTSAIQSVNGVTVQLASAIPGGAIAGLPWEISLPTAQAQLFEVVRVKDQGDGSYLIESFSYVPGKYDFVELGLALPSVSISILPDPLRIPPPPTEFTWVETLRLFGGLPEAVVDLFWRSPDYSLVRDYELQYKLAENVSWNNPFSALSPSYSIGPIDAGTYDFRVRTVNTIGRNSEWTYLNNVVIVGKTAPPENVSGLKIDSEDNESITLSWNAANDLDVFIGGTVELRIVLGLVGDITASDWDVATPMAILSGKSTTFSTDFEGGFYFAKFKDSFGNYSLAATMVTTESLTTRPEDVKGFNLSSVSETSSELSWLIPQDFDLAQSGQVELRYTPYSASNPRWETAQRIGSKLGATTTSKTVNFAGGTYFAKFIDRRKNESLNAAAITSTGTEFLKRNLVAALTETAWPGLKTGVINSPAPSTGETLDWQSTTLQWQFMTAEWSTYTGPPTASGPAPNTIENQPVLGWQLNELNWEDIDDEWTTYVDPPETTVYQRISWGTYDFGESLVLKQGGPIQIEGSIDFDISLDALAPPGSVAEGTAEIQIKIGENIGSYGIWQPFSSMVYVGKAFQFRIVFIARNPYTVVTVKKIQISADVEDRSFFREVTTTSTGWTTVYFEKDYTVAPKSFGFTIQDGASGDLVQIGSKSADFVEIRAFNAQNAIVARKVAVYTESY
jgi:predicted phage tail protein